MQEVVSDDEARRLNLLVLCNCMWYGKIPELDQKSRVDCILGMRFGLIGKAGATNWDRIFSENDASYGNRA